MAGVENNETIVPGAQTCRMTGLAEVEAIIENRTDDSATTATTNIVKSLCGPEM